MKYLVTGGRSPLALAVVQVLNNLGANTVLVTRNRDASIEELASAYDKCSLWEWDLADCRSTLEAFDDEAREQPFDGIVMMHRYRGERDDSLQYQVDVLTPFSIIERLTATASSTRRSVVVATSPGARVVVGDQPFQYHASKAALVALVRFAAVRFANQGLRINGVSPGAYVEKLRSRDFYAQNPERAKWADWVTPLGRQAKDHEIASVVAFLLSGESSFVTGQIIEIDGGVSLRDQPSLDPANMPSISLELRPTQK